MGIKSPYDRFLMMVGLSLLLCLLDRERPFWTGFLITLSFTFVYWEGNYQIVAYVRKRFPKYEQTVKRILTQAAISVVFTLAAGTIMLLVLQALSYITFQTDYLLQSLMMGLIITFIISIVYETVFYFQLWKETLLESERLKKTEARLQFESLKNQINPHFLFNSLNTLSSLIHVDQDRAEMFVQKFAEVYRHVLKVKEKTFMPLEEEIELVNSYVFLQKIRFNDQLVFKNNILVEPGRFFIPPLILQNLVENCIKHNVISEKFPLKVELTVENRVLIVKNKLQERENNKESTKTGLYNIQQRMKLLSDKEARFYKMDGYFIAEVPLVESD